MKLYNNLTLMVVLMIFSLTSCVPTTLKRLEEAGKPPVLESVALPQTRADYKEVMWPKEMSPQEKESPKRNPIKTNSLWNHSSRSFFKDTRSSNIGDIVKVKINVSDKAALSNKSTRKRQTTENFVQPKIFNLEEKFLNPTEEGDSDSLLSLSGNNNNLGSGAIDRSEVIDTEIAAIITQILPNGNLVIAGKQEIEVNYELRQISIQGIIRTEDITSNNSIESSKIAELRLVYGGKGHVSDVQQPRLGTQLVDILSPF